MPTRRRRVKRKRIKRRRIIAKHKERPVRVYETKTGRRYIKHKGKRLYFGELDTGLSTNELIKYIVGQFTEKQRKAKKNKNKKANAKGNAKTSNVGFAPPSSSAYSSAVNRELSGLQFQLQQKSQQLERQIVAVDRAQNNFAKKEAVYGTAVVAYNADGDIPTEEEITRVAKAQNGKEFQVSKEYIRNIQKNARKARSEKDKAETKLISVQETLDKMGAEMIEKQKQLDSLAKQTTEAESRATRQAQKYDEDILKRSLKAAELEGTIKILKKEKNAQIDSKNKDIYDDWYKSVKGPALRTFAKTLSHLFQGGTVPNNKATIIDTLKDNEVFVEKYGKPEYIRKEDVAAVIEVAPDVELVERVEDLDAPPPFASASINTRQNGNASVIEIVDSALDVLNPRKLLKWHSESAEDTKIERSYEGDVVSEHSGIADEDYNALLYEDEDGLNYQDYNPDDLNYQDYQDYKPADSWSETKSNKLKPDDSWSDTKSNQLAEFTTQIKDIINNDDYSEVSTQEGSEYSAGGMKSMSKGGLYNNQIETMMKKCSNFVGVFAADELANVPTKKKEFGFIMNTKPRKVSRGGHWVAVYIDADRSMSCEYYDSFAKSPSKQFMKDIKKIIDKLKLDVYLKFKANKIKDQNAKTQNCGWFAMQFLLNRFRGLPFKDVSGYSDTVKGEKSVKKLKKTFGYI